MTKTEKKLYKLDIEANIAAREAARWDKIHRTLIKKAIKLLEGDNK